LQKKVKAIFFWYMRNTTSAFNYRNTCIHDWYRKSVHGTGPVAFLKRSSRCRRQKTSPHLVSSLVFMRNAIIWQWLTGRHAKLPLNPVHFWSGFCGTLSAKIVTTYVPSVVATIPTMEIKVRKLCFLLNYRKKPKMDEPDWVLELVIVPIYYRKLVWLVIDDVW
jgi:hypothetical protein